MSPLQRSLAKLRKEGWLCAITEKWNPHAKIRQDLFGFIDLLAIKGDTIIAVQTTSGAHVQERIAKIRDNPNFLRWIESTSRQIYVHGWSKRGPGKRKRWTCRVVRLKHYGDEDIGPTPCAVGSMAEVESP